MREKGKRKKTNGDKKQRRDSKECSPVQVETVEEKKIAKVDREEAKQTAKVDPEEEAEE